MLPKTFLVSISLLGSIACLSAQALPGDTVQSAIQRFRQNELTRNADFQPINFGNNYIPEYRATILYQDISINISISTPEANFTNNVSESFWIDNPSIGNRLNQHNYNLREDERLLQIIAGIWGESVAIDFANSLFTDRIEEVAQTAHRTSYKGDKFGYTARYMNIENRFAFTVSTLEEWELRRLPGEFDERVTQTKPSFSVSDTISSRFQLEQR